MTHVPSEYEFLIEDAARQTGIPYDVVAAQISLESGFKPNVFSPTGAYGIAQFEPGTWKEYGQGSFLNAGNPKMAMAAYVKYMKYLMRVEKGDIQKALAAYNAGPGDLRAGMGYATTVLQNAGTPSVDPMATDNNGVDLANSNASQFVPTATPHLSLEQLKSEYPLVYATLHSVPELQGIFQQMVQGTMSPDGAIAAIQNSHWFATHSDTARQIFATMKADPATYSQRVTNLEAQLQQMATEIGAQLSHSQVQELGVDALFKGYDTNQAMLRQKFMQYVKPVSGNHFGGQAGSDEDQLRQAMRDMGVFLPESQLAQQLQQIAGGTQTVQGVQAQLRTQAASMYPAYASQINSGMNVSDIAAPYMSRAQQLLEMGPGSMNISSPLIKQALQYAPGGVPTAMPLGDFEKSVRQDPRWLQTDNAQDSIMSNAHKVLTDFGFEY